MVFFQLLYGPLAHLVERIHGMDEVTGSIPVRSTKTKTRPKAEFWFDRLIISSYIIISRGFSCVNPIRGRKVQESAIPN